MEAGKRSIVSVGTRSSLGNVVIETTVNGVKRIIANGTNEVSLFRQGANLVLTTSVIGQTGELIESILGSIDLRDPANPKTEVSDSADDEDPKEGDKTCSVCSNTIRGLKEKDLLCKKLRQISGYNPSSATTLCNSTHNNTALLALCQKILTLQDAEIQAFLGDIQNTSVCSGTGGCLANNVSNLTVSLIDSWKILYDSRCTGCDEKREMDWALLTKVNVIQGDATLLNDMKTTESSGKQALINIISRNKRAGCVVCSPPDADARHLRKITEYLDDVQNLVMNYKTRNGTRFLLDVQGLKSTSTNQVEASAFIIKVLNSSDYLAFSGGKDVDRFEAAYQDGSDCSADIKMVNGRLIECKSWNLYNPNTWGNMPSNQFLTYLGAISTMDGLSYWFDAGKITGSTDADKLSALKTKFQEVFRKTDTKGNNIVFEKIWANNLGLRESLFPRANYEQTFTPQQYHDAALATYQTYTNTLNTIIFNFLNVK